MTDKKNTAILAYSGGLDSTISIDWIKKNYGFDVITLTVGLGNGGISQELIDRAKSAGAINCIQSDVSEEFINDYVFPALKAAKLDLIKALKLFFPADWEPLDFSCARVDIV